jgi:hypothetical protein
MRIWVSRAVASEPAGIWDQRIFRGRLFTEFVGRIGRFARRFLRDGSPFSMQQAADDL